MEHVLRLQCGPEIGHGQGSTSRDGFAYACQRVARRVFVRFTAITTNPLNVMLL